MKRPWKILAAVMAAVAAFGQQPPAGYEVRTALRPRMTIGGHVFDKNTTIAATVINDAGEVAFVARWTFGPSERSSVFTLQRLVSSGEGFIEGVALLGIPANAHIAISPSGLVAYQAFYDIGNAPTGIFVERLHAVDSAPLIPDLIDFAVDDDGHISLKERQPNHDAYPLSGNGRGQIVIPVNTPEGPYLFIGTPRTYAKAR